MRVVLPYPPSANRYWRKYRGHMTVSDQARQYKEDAAILARASGVRPLAGDVSVSIGIHRPARRGDLDNCLKILLDSLKGVAFEDDKQVVEIHAARYEDKANPRAEVEINPR